MVSRGIGLHRNLGILLVNGVRSLSNVAVENCGAALVISDGHAYTRCYDARSGCEWPIYTCLETTQVLNSFASVPLHDCSCRYGPCMFYTTYCTIGLLQNLWPMRTR